VAPMTIMFFFLHLFNGVKMGLLWVVVFPHNRNNEPCHFVSWRLGLVREFKELFLLYCPCFITKASNFNSFMLFCKRKRRRCFIRKRMNICRIGNCVVIPFYKIMIAV